MKILIILALLLPVPLAARTRCTHSCGRYACKQANCGKTCKMGPHCRGCWKR